MAGVKERRTLLRYSDFSGCPIDKRSYETKKQGGNCGTVVGSIIEGYLMNVNQEASVK
jgi:hypothetical protein